MNRTRSPKTYTPVVFLGVLLLGLSESQAVSVTWDGGAGAGDKNWSTGTNWAPTVPPGTAPDNTVPAAGDNVVFDNTASNATAGTVTNIVSSSLTIGSLNYSNTGATNTHTTQIDSGQMLTVANTGPNFSIGSVGVTKVNFTGGGKLVVTNLNQLLGNVNGGTTVVDMSQLNTYSTSGGGFFSGPAFASAHTVTMAATNFWQVGQFRIHSSFSNNNSFKLGQTNTIQINSDDFQLGTGGGSTGNTIGFMAGLSGTPTLTIRGYNGGIIRAPAGMYIGQQSSNSPNGTSLVMDLTATGGTDGSIDARLTSLVIGDKTNTVNDTGGGTGTLIYDQGTVDSLTVTLGRITNASLTAAAVTNGTLTVGGTGTFVADTINFGSNAGNASSSANGTLNVSGGTIQATTMQPGAGTATTRAITFNSGKIQNKASTSLTIASGLTFNSLTSGLHTFEADSGQSITVNSALVGAGTGDVVKAGLGTLNFNAANTYAGNTLINSGTLALGASGSITSPSITVASGATLNVGSVSGGYSLASGQTLKGGGSVSGGVTAASGSTLSPGTSPGSLEFDSTLNLQSGASLAIELGGTSFTLNGTEDYDRVKVTGATTLAGNLSVSLINSFTLGLNEVFGILDAVGGRSGLFANYAEYATVLVNNGFILKITYLGSFGNSGTPLTTGGSDVVLFTLPVPEPNSFVLMLMAVCAVWTIRRKQLA